MNNVKNLGCYRSCFCTKINTDSICIACRATILILFCCRLKMTKSFKRNTPWILQNHVRKRFFIFVLCLFPLASVSYAPITKFFLKFPSLMIQDIVCFVLRNTAINAQQAIRGVTSIHNNFLGFRRIAYGVDNCSECLCSIQIRLFSLIYSTFLPGTQLFKKIVAIISGTNTQRQNGKTTGAGIWRHHYYFIIQNSLSFAFRL